LAAMLESIDDGVGLITAKLAELGLAENTIVIFSSDNGGESNVTSNAPLRGGKSQLYEGGIRVPMIVRWPGKVKPGAVCESPTVNVDFYPTFVEAAEAKTTQSLDGVSILPLFADPTVELPSRPFCWHYPLEKPHFLGGVSAGAIRDQNWKLIELFDTGELELYDLDQDPSETRNLAAEHPERAQQLLAKLKSWRAEVKAN
jgi:arylsulfatase A